MAEHDLREVLRSPPIRQRLEVAQWKVTNAIALIDDIPTDGYDARRLARVALVVALDELVGVLRELEPLAERDSAVIKARPVPVVPAKPSETGLTWLVPCAYCRRWHVHGPDDGDRAAHCIEPSSPYLQTGYVLELDPEKADRLAEAVIPKRRRRRKAP